MLRLTLKCSFIRGHLAYWKWHHSIDHIRLTTIVCHRNYNCTVVELFDVKNTVILKCELEITQGNWKLYHSEATVLFPHGTGTLRCLQKDMATYRCWFVFLWRDPDNVPHCRILSLDKTEWRLISATLCGWRRCFVADQLCFMTRIREEEVRFPIHIL